MGHMMGVGRHMGRGLSPGVCVCGCKSTLLAGAAVERDPAVDGSLLNISDVIRHDRNLKMNMSEINPVMSFLSFFLRHSI